MRLKLFILFVAFDQISKLLALKYSQPAFNSGIAFGVGENIPLLAILIIFLVLFLSVGIGRSGFGEIFLLAGGAGNILDRLIYGKIVDWIKFGSLWFNLADVYIVGGIILMFSHLVIPAKAGIYINNYLYRFRVKHGMTVEKKI